MQRRRWLGAGGRGQGQQRQGEQRQRGRCIQGSGSRMVDCTGTQAVQVAGSKLAGWPSSPLASRMWAWISCWVRAVRQMRTSAWEGDVKAAVMGCSCCNAAFRTIHALTSAAAGHTLSLSPLPSPSGPHKHTCTYRPSVRSTPAPGPHSRRSSPALLPASAPRPAAAGESCR